MDLPPQPDLLDSLAEAFAAPNRRSSATHQAAARGPEAIPAIRAILDGSVRNAFGANPYGVLSEPFRCALVTARLMGAAATPLVPLIAAAFRRGSGPTALEALLALTEIAPADESTLAILAEALARDAELAANAALEIVRLGLLEHPAISRTLETSTTAQGLVDWAAKQTKPA